MIPMSAIAPIATNARSMLLLARFEESKKTAPARPRGPELNSWSRAGDQPDLETLSRRLPQRSTALFTVRDVVPFHI